MYSVCDALWPVNACSMSVCMVKTAGFEQKPPVKKMPPGHFFLTWRFCVEHIVFTVVKWTHQCILRVSASLDLPGSWGLRSSGKRPRLAYTLLYLLHIRLPTTDWRSDQTRATYNFPSGASIFCILHGWRAGWRTQLSLLVLLSCYEIYLVWLSVRVVSEQLGSEFSPSQVRDACRSHVVR